MFLGFLHSCYLIKMTFVLTLLALVLLAHMHYCKHELNIEIAYERKTVSFQLSRPQSGRLWRLFNMADLFYLYPVLTRP